MSKTYCNCNDCKKMRRKGKILGAMRWGGDRNYFVSAYVPFYKFLKGRRPEAVDRY